MNMGKAMEPSVAMGLDPKNRVIGASLACREGGLGGLELYTGYFPR